MGNRPGRSPARRPPRGTRRRSDDSKNLRFVDPGMGIFGYSKPHTVHCLRLRRWVRWALALEPEARHYRSEAPRPIVPSIGKLRMNLLELQLLILASGMSSEVGLSERAPVLPENGGPIAAVVALPVQVGPYS